MNMPDQLNAAIRFIEENLCGEIDGDELARIACVTKDDFMLFQLHDAERNTSAAED